MESLKKEAGKRSVDKVLVRKYCRSLGGIPASMRKDVYIGLLGGKKMSRGSTPAELDAEEVELVEKDIVRTRPQDGFTKDGVVQQRLGHVLKSFLQQRGYKYTQGMAEVFAVFYLVDKDLPVHTVINCATTLFTEYFPQLYSNKGELKTLTKQQFLFSLLLQYHDPKLALRLQQSNAPPSSYFTSWIMTLFAQKHSSEVVLHLWDEFLLQGDPLLPFFLSAALVMSKRDDLLSKPDDELPSSLSELHIADVNEADSCLKGAHGLLATTPKTFVDTLRVATVHDDNIHPEHGDSASLLSLRGQWCVHVSPKEVINAGKHYVLVDIRPEEEYVHGHFSTSVHVDPSHFGKEEFQALLTTLRRYDGRHLALLCPTPVKGGGGSGDVRELSSDAMFKSVALKLIQEGFLYVSVIDGGYKEMCTAHIGMQKEEEEEREGEKRGQESGIEVVDHDGTYWRWVMDPSSASIQPFAPRPPASDKQQKGREKKGEKQRGERQDASGSGKAEKKAAAKSEAKSEVASVGGEGWGQKEGGSEKQGEVERRRSSNSSADIAAAVGLITSGQGKSADVMRRSRTSDDRSDEGSVGGSDDLSAEGRASSGGGGSMRRGGEGKGEGSESSGKKKASKIGNKFKSFGKAIFSKAKSAVTYIKEKSDDFNANKGKEIRKQMKEAFVGKMREEEKVLRQNDDYVDQALVHFSAIDGGTATTGNFVDLGSASASAYIQEGKTLFKVLEVGESGGLEKRYILLGQRNMAGLEAHRTRLGFAHIRWVCPILHVVKITAKKAERDVLMIHFKGDTKRKLVVSSEAKKIISGEVAAAYKRLEAEGKERKMEAEEGGQKEVEERKEEEAVTDVERAQREKSGNSSGEGSTVAGERESAELTPVDEEGVSAASSAGSATPASVEDLLTSMSLERRDEGESEATGVEKKGDVGDGKKVKEEVNFYEDENEDE